MRPSIALAETATDRETARLLMDRGDEQLERGDLETALASYRGAHELMHVPTTGIELARCLEKTGRLVEARDAAIEVLRMPAAAEEPHAFKVARAAAQQFASKLVDQIPLLRIEITPPQAAQRGSLSIDGNRVPVAAVGLPYSLNPGQHSILLSAPGFQAFGQNINLDRSERRSLVVELKPLPPEAPPPRKPTPKLDVPPLSRLSNTETPPSVPWPVWLGIGAGGVGLLVGSVAGAISLDRAKDAKSACAANRCPPEAKSDRDAALAAANVSNLGFVLGAVGASVSIASWWLSRPTQAHQPTAMTLGLTTSAHGGLLQLGGTLW